MTKNYCDVCETEITAGSMAGSFDKIEASLKKEQPFTMQHWDLCQECAGKLKVRIVELDNE